MSSGTPHYESPAPMTAAQKALIEKENHFRQLFAEDPNSGELHDPHLMLENVFEHEHEFVFQAEDAEEKAVPKLLTQCRKLGLTGKAIVSQNEFMTRFTTFTNGVLNGLDWSNVFCAGGAILGNLVADNAGYSSSDIDLFLYGIGSDEAANAKLRQIHALVVRNTGCQGDVIRTARAVTILNTHPYRHVQVVLRAYKSPAEVLLGFDIDSCTVGFDGKNVYCMERFKRALTKGYNLVNISRRSLTYEQRLYKYSRRGFAVAVPNLDKTRVNAEIFTKRIKELYGLSKLLLYDHLSQQQIERSRSGNAATAVNYRIQSQESSDYNGDLEIPWGPNFSAKSILNILKVKDRRQFWGQMQKLKQAKKAGASSTFGADSAPKKAEHLFETIFFDTTNSDGSKQPKIEWIRNNPAYQDLDGGFTRPLMTGSFQLPPPVQAVWDLNSYAPNATNVGGLSEDQGYVPGEWKSSHATTTYSASSFPSNFVDTTASQLGGLKIGSTPSPVKAATPSSGPSPKRFGGGFMSNDVTSATSGGVFSSGPIDLSAFGGPSATSAATTTFARPATQIFEPQKFTVAAKKKREPVPVATSSSSSSYASKNEAFETIHPPSIPPFVSYAPAPGMDHVLREIAGLKLFIVDALKGQSTLQHPTGQEEAPPTTKLLLLVSLCYKQGSLTSDEKGTLKDLIIERHHGVFGALEVFEVDQDLEELVDTFKRLVKSKTAPSASF